MTIPKVSPPSHVDLDETYLPIGRMRQLSRVTYVNRASIVAELDIENHWAFAVHFPGDAIFPGTLQIEAAGQLLAVWAWWTGERGRPRLLRSRARFYRPIVPEDRLITLEASVSARRNISLGEIRILVGDRLAAEVSARLAVLDDSAARS